MFLWISTFWPIFFIAVSKCIAYSYKMTGTVGAVEMTYRSVVKNFVVARIFSLLPLTRWYRTNWPSLKYLKPLKFSILQSSSVTTLLFSFCIAWLLAKHLPVQVQLLNVSHHISKWECKRVEEAVQTLCISKAFLTGKSSVPIHIRTKWDMGRAFGLCAWILGLW